MPRSLLGIAALLALAVVFWVSLPSDRPSSAASPPPDGDPAPELDLERPRTADAAELMGRAAEAVVRDAVGESPEGAAAAPEATLERVTWAGRVVVHDGDRRLERESGTFEAFVRTAEQREVREFELTDGAFELEVDPADPPLRAHFVSGLLGGRFAIRPEGGSRWESGQGDVIVLRALRPPSIRIEARAEETGEHLEQVTILQQLGTADSYPPGRQGDHPGLDPSRTSVLAEGAISPVEIPFGDVDSRFGHDRLFPEWQFGQLVLYIGAPGREWTSIQYPVTRAEPRAVVLSRAGSIDLRVTNVPGGQDLDLVLDPEEGSGLRLPLDDNFADRIDGLPVGQLAVRVERKQNFIGEARVFAEKTIELQAGETEDVHLVVDDAASERVPRYDVTLELRLGAAWGPKAQHASVACVDSADGSGARGQTKLEPPTKGGDLVGRVELEDAPEGTYRITLARLGMAIDVEIDAPGRRVFVLPDPVELVVRVRDSDGQGIESGLRLSVMGVARERYSVPIMPSPTQDADGSFTARVPDQTIRLQVHQDGRESFYHDLEVTPPRHTVDLTWPIWTRLTLVHRAGEQVLEPENFFATEVEPLDAAGRAHFTDNWDETAGWIDFQTPGTYRITPSPIDGFRSPDPVDVVVAEGIAQRVSFEYEAIE